MIVTPAEMNLPDWDKLRLLFDDATDRVCKGDEFHDSDNEALTARKFDVSQTSGKRVYVGAHRLLTVAAENFESFGRFIHEVGFSLHAPYNLLRPVLECSLWAIWLLEDKHGAVRRKRALALDWLDFRNEIAYYGELLHTDFGQSVREFRDKRRTDVNTVYEAEAAAFNTSWKVLDQHVLPSTTGIAQNNNAIRLHWGEPAMYLVAAEWRKLSGFQHGKAWSTGMSSDRGESVLIEGGHRVHLTPNDASAQMSIQAAVLAYVTAARLYERRSTRTD